jgi:hypothetical protein
MGIPGIEFDGIEGQKFDNDDESEPGLGIDRDACEPDMLVWQGDLRKLTLFRLNPFL